MELRYHMINQAEVHDYLRTIDKLIADRDELTIKLEKSEKSLDNCLRIMRERANAARNLTPKKSHPGYVLLTSQQWSQSYTADQPEAGYEDRTPEWLRKHNRMKEERKIADVWKTVMQTPYDASLGYDLIKERFENDIEEQDLLTGLGFYIWVKDGTDESYKDFGTDETGEPINAVYKYRFRSNFRSGLWEVELYSNLPLRLTEKSVDLIR